MKAKNDKQWHDLVCRKANYTCQVCQTHYGHTYCFDENGRNQYVCGHHKLTKGSHPELRLDVENGLCICDKCHKNLHNGNIIL